MGEFRVTAEGWLSTGGWRYPCALGRAGIVRAKREGDGATPAGRWPLREVLYRSDRVARPATGLPLSRIAPADGWCDDPDHADYNRRVRLPHAARCEHLWREDALYDLICVIGYNDAPPLSGHGSAIFLHAAGPGYSPTAGCVALAPGDLRAILAAAAPGDHMVIVAPIP